MHDLPEEFWYEVIFTAYYPETVEVLSRYVKARNESGAISAISNEAEYYEVDLDFYDVKKVTIH